MMRWYVLRLRPGGEAGAMEALTGLGYQVMLPRAARMIRRAGVWKETEYILIPGYLIVYTAYDADNYYRIKGVPEVLGFCGGADNYLSYPEVEWMRTLSSAQILRPSKVIKTAAGYEVTEGVLGGFVPEQIRLDARERKATLRITVCGEERQVTLGIEVLGEPEAEILQEDTEAKQDQGEVETPVPCEDKG